MKKKVPKVASVTTLVDDILRGIEFPKPRTVDPSDSFMDDNGESLARERLGYKMHFVYCSYTIWYLIALLFLSLWVYVLFLFINCSVIGLRINNNIDMKS